MKKIINTFTNKDGEEVKITEEISINGNEISIQYEEETPHSIKFGTITNQIRDIRPKSNECICEWFCKQYYCFGTSWDKRCSHNSDKPIHQCVNECIHFKKYQKIGNMIKSRINEDNLLIGATPVDIGLNHDIHDFIAIFSKYDPNKEYLY